MVVEGPQISLVPQSTTTVVTFQGPVQVGDTAVFVPSLSDSGDDIDCASPPSGSVRALVETGGGAQFTFDTLGRYVLCYRFNFLEWGGSVAGARTFELFADIRLGVVTLDTALASPLGTAVGCETIVRVPGGGFTSLGVDMPAPRCCFGEGCSLWSVAAEIGATMLACTIPGGSEITSVSPGLSIEFGALLSYPVLDSFTVYDMSMARLDLPSPRAGSYNLATDLQARCL